VRQRWSYKEQCKMKTVLDANVIVSASVWGGNPREVITRFSDGLDKLFITEDIVYDGAERC